MTLTTGVVVAAACFAVALVAELLGAEPGDGELTDLRGVAAGLADATPWAWAAAGTYAVLVTPMLGLVATTAEYASVGDRRTVLTAAAVLLVLVLSAVVAVLR